MAAGGGRDEFGALATPAERDGLAVVTNELGEESGRLDDRRRACARVRVEHRPFPHREAAGGRWRSVVVERDHVVADERSGERGRIADGRARRTERRVRSVVIADATQPTEQLCDVATEHATQRVQFVDDDVAKAHEERCPAIVARQDAHVEHLGIREQHVRVASGPRPVVGMGVTVVGDGFEAGHEPTAHRLELVVGEGLRREQQQRSRTFASHHRIDDRHLITQRLSRGSSRRDGDVLAADERVDRRALVAVEIAVAARGEALTGLGVQVAGRLRGSGRSRRDLDLVDETPEVVGFEPRQRQDVTRVHGSGTRIGCGRCTGRVRLEHAVIADVGEQLRRRALVEPETL